MIAKFRIRDEPLIVISSRYNSQKCVSTLIRLHVDVNEKCAHGRNAFWHGARWGNLDLVRELYSFGAEIDDPDALGVTPFGVACIQGHLPVVEYLYRQSASLATNRITLNTGTEWPPLFFSIAYGNRGVSDFLIRKCGPVSLSYRDADGRSAISVAILAGRFELAHLVIKRLMEDFGEINLAKSLLCSPAGTTGSPLWLAAYHGNIRSTDWILSSLKYELKFSASEISEQVNCMHQSLPSPLAISIVKDNVPVARRLIQAGARVDAYHPYFDAAVLACRMGSLDALKLLLHSGAARNREELLYNAALDLGHSQLVEYLEKTRGFSTRIHYAAELPEQLVYEMIRAGADLEYKGFNASADAISPLEVAEREMEKENGLGVPIQVRWIVEACKPWSADNHFLFDMAARETAKFLFLEFGHGYYRGLPPGVWQHHIIPFAVQRLNPPLSRYELTRVFPGDGNP